MPTLTEHQRRRFRELHRALVADVQADVETAVRVGVLSAGYTRAHVARMLGVDARDMALPIERLERVAESLDRDGDLF